MKRPSRKQDSFFIFLSEEAKVGRTLDHHDDDDDPACLCQHFSSKKSYLTG